LEPSVFWREVVRAEKSMTPPLSIYSKFKVRDSITAPLRGGGRLQNNTEA